MALIRLNARVTTSGPMFDGRGARAVHGYVEELEEDGADWALGHIQKTYHASFKNPTGYYESHVRVSNLAGDPVVNDGGSIVYGPWLEGVGSRNNTTRFKGYHAFRKAAVALEARMESIGYSLLERKWLRRIG